MVSMDYDWLSVRLARHDSRCTRHHLLLLAAVSPARSRERTMMERPRAIGVSYSSNANLVLKSLLIGPYWPSCCCSQSETRSRCFNSWSFVATNKEAMFSSSFPSWTPLPPWWGGPGGGGPGGGTLI